MWGCQCLHDFRVVVEFAVLLAPFTPVSIAAFRQFPHTYPENVVASTLASTCPWESLSELGITRGSSLVLQWSIWCSRNVDYNMRSGLD